MSYYDYKIVPAPKKARKVKGVHGAAELFALTLGEAVNELARQGWEYQRSEQLTIETPGGWLRRGRAEEHTVLVFRRAREHLSPRIADPEREPAFEPAARPEPRLGRSAAAEPADPPFRPLGPAARE